MDPFGYRQHSLIILEHFILYIVLHCGSRLYTLLVPFRGLHDTCITPHCRHAVVIPF